MKFSILPTFSGLPLLEALSVGDMVDRQVWFLSPWGLTPAEAEGGGWESPQKRLWRFFFFFLKPKKMHKGALQNARSHVSVDCYITKE